MNVEEPVLVASSATLAMLAVLLAATVLLSGTAGAVVSNDFDGSGEATTAADTSAGVTPISDCRMITEPGYYRLETGLVDRTEETYTNVTIKDVEVTDYGYNIWIETTDRGRIVNSTFRDNGIYGIYLGYDANTNNIANNRVVNTTSPDLDIPGQGIVLANIANENDIIDNYVEESERFGIAIHLGDRNRIGNNTVFEPGRHGITGQGTGTVIVDNDVERSGEAGIFYAFANESSVTGNDV